MATFVTVTGTYRGPDGTSIPSGKVTFVLDVARRDEGGNRIYPRVKEVAKLNSSGEISVSLLASDDAGIFPEGTTYEVIEEIDTAPSRRYHVELPAAGGAVNLADIAPSEPAGQYYLYTTVLDFEAHLADTTNVHGIPDTSVLATDTEVAIAVAAEAVLRTNADAALQAAIDALPTDGDVAAAVAAEATLRAAGDAALDARLDEVEDLNLLSVAIKTVTGPYTLIASDLGKLIIADDAVTFPPDVFDVGAVITVMQSGVGPVLLVEGTGVDLEAPEDWLTLGGDRARAQAILVEPNVWYVDGNLTG